MMARVRSTVGTEDEESFEIEVLRNVSQLQTTCTLVTNCTADSIPDLSLICRNRRKRAELTPERGRGNGEQKNGCCHSTPLLDSASKNMPLKEYFSGLSLPVVGFMIRRDKLNSQFIVAKSSILHAGGRSLFRFHTSSESKNGYARIRNR